MRRLLAALPLVALVMPLPAGEPANKPNYDALAGLLHQMAVKRLPKEIEDDRNWGMTIPVPEKLPLPRLRTYLKAGDQTVLPHGAWRRFKGKIEDPDKNLKIVVRDFQPLDDKTYRLTFDADATIRGAGQWQQWQKGLLLVEADGEATANIVAGIICDVGVSFDLTKFPPAVALEPKVRDLKLDLRELRFPNAPEVGDNTKVEDRLRDVLREALRLAEPTLKEEANRALAEGFRDGKGTVSAAQLLKIVPPVKK